MPNAMKSYVVSVTSLETSKTLYEALLGTPPHVDSEWYVGFNVDGLEIGLTPAGGAAEAIPYIAVGDIHAAIEDLVAAGATVRDEASEVGGGVTVAVVLDGDSNPIGLITGG